MRKSKSGSDKTALPPSADSFFALTPDRVLDAVEQLGFRCTGRCLALNSLENRVYEIELDRGPAQFVVAKFYRPARWSFEQIVEEHEFCFELAEADIPVVAPLKRDDGVSVLTIESIGLYGALFPKMSGRLEVESSDEELQWLGRLLARVHNIGARRPFLFRPKVSPEWYLRWNQPIVEGLLPADCLNGYRMMLDTAAQLFFDIPSIRLHGDCHRGNILWRGSEGPILVDLDDSLMGPPVQDLWLLIPSRDEEGERQLQQMITGYRLIRDFDDRSLKMIELLRFSRMVQYAGWVARRWEDPSFPRAFPHFNTEDYWRKHLAELREQLSWCVESG